MPLPKAQQIDWLHHDNEWLRKAEEVAEKDDNELFEWEVNQRLKAERKKDDNELVEWGVNQKPKAERIAAGPRPPRSAPPPHLLQPDEWVRI